MTRSELVLKLKQTLLRRRKALRDTLVDHASMLAVNTHGVGDTIDAALDCEQDELDSQLAAVESRELAAIDAALARIRAGVYGSCEDCGKQIPTARLQAVPYATLCIKCQRFEERSRNRGGARFHWERVADELPDDETNDINGLELELV